MQEQEKLRQETEPLTDSTPGNGSRPTPTPSNRSQIQKDESHSPQDRSQGETKGRSPVRRASGPRTPTGKQRSKNNAIKHGIFSIGFLLKDESWTDFRSLHRELRADLHPGGFVEEVLVQNLAIVLWRKKRFFKAETAEIAKGINFLELDEVRAEHALVVHCGEANVSSGLLNHASDPGVLQAAVLMLKQLRRNVERRGLHIDEDEKLLRTVYGLFSPDFLPEDLHQAYVSFASSAGGKGKVGHPVPPDVAKHKVITCIDAEINRLQELDETLRHVESVRRLYSARALLVPRADVAERLQRYEAHLSCEFNRTLSQLERLQRMHLGHAVPPPLKVEISS